MSAKARLAWLMSAAYRSLVSSSPPPRRASFERQEPSLSAAPRLHWRRSRKNSTTRKKRKTRTEEVPAARAPRKKAAPRGGAQIRKIRTAFGLGAHGAQGVGPAAAQQGRTGGQFARAGRRARRFRRPRRDRQGQSRPGRDAVRTRTAPGIKSSRVIGLADDIARSMSALGPRRLWSPAATPSASNCLMRIAKRFTCANC